MIVASGILVSLSTGSVLFRDDFDGKVLKSSDWSSASWKLGRTRFGLTPELKDGVAQLEHRTFDPQLPGKQFLGTEIFTVRSFERKGGIEIEARVRGRNLPEGLVASLFTYATVNKLSDEIDFEFLTTEIAKSSRGETPILLTNWNNWDESKEAYGDQIHHSSETVNVKNLDLREFNVFTIRWLRDRTEWLVNQKVVRISKNAVPDAASPIRLNFWAALPAWKEAYSSKYSPVDRLEQNSTATYEIDYVEVRSIQ
jgi:beta-glucanase (GH16 family)